MKIVTIIGARPQFIKAATVSRVIHTYDDIQESIIHTGQHFDENMSQIFFEELDIPRPKYNLDIHSLNHGAMTGRMLEGIENLLIQEKGDIVLVYGDTNSTLAGALAASKLHIPVAHVEAGLRSFNMLMPEEINRILTDRVSRYLFCPTPQAMENLTLEGFESGNYCMVNTGDVMFDAALYYGTMAQKPSTAIPEKFVLSTLHRAENTDNLQHLQSIINALTEIASQIPVVLPVHPRTQAILKKNQLLSNNAGITIIPPVGYLNMIYLLKNCTMVMTDSGGLQKEAYFFKKPCITLRSETEWMELVHSGVNTLSGYQTHRILESFTAFQNQRIDFPKQLYGEGKAAEKIVKILKDIS